MAAVATRIFHHNEIEYLLATRFTETDALMVMALSLTGRAWRGRMQRAATQKMLGDIQMDRDLARQAVADVIENTDPDCCSLEFPEEDEGDADAILLFSWDGEVDGSPVQGSQAMAPTPPQEVFADILDGLLFEAQQLDAEERYLVADRDSELRRAKQSLKQCRAILHGRQTAETVTLSLMLPMLETKTRRIAQLEKAIVDARAVVIENATKLAALPDPADSLSGSSSESSNHHKSDSSSSNEGGQEPPASSSHTPSPAPRTSFLAALRTPVTISSNTLSPSSASKPSSSPRAARPSPRKRTRTASSDALEFDEAALEETRIPRRRKRKL